MVFTLPSLPSGILGGLIDTSPPVFYPPSRNTPTKSRSRSKSKSSITNNNITVDSPNRIPFSLPLQSPSRAQTPKEQDLGNLLPASASTTDLTGVWEPIQGGGLGEKRRASISSTTSLTNVSRPDSPQSKLTPTRPTHRRCHSALPSSLAQSGKSNNFSIPPPTGKLQEFSISRNPLASTSAISLPTLVEGELNDQPLWSGRSSMPPSPLVRPRNRNSSISKISPISPSLKSNLSLEEEEEEIAEHSDDDIPVLKFIKPSLERQNSTSSVPPPLDNRQIIEHEYSSSSSMPPPPLNPMNITYSPSCKTKPRSKSIVRPLISPRSWSVQDIHSLNGNGDKSSKQGLHSRRGSIESTSSISDIAVLATWSFPHMNIPPNNSRGKNIETGIDDLLDRGRKPGPSERLKERLKNIPGIETGPFPSSGSLPSLSRTTSHNSGNTTEQRKVTRTSTMVVKPSRPLPSYLKNGHRHTHSSPNLLTIPGVSTPTRQGQMGPPALPSSSSNPLLPPPKPVQRRPTTSRLRQPNPLTMSNVPTHQSQPSLGGIRGEAREFGSSPGSMGSLSDTSTSCPSPTNSIKSLPSVTIPSDSEDGNGKNDRAWWSFPTFKRDRSQSIERESQKSPSIHARRVGEENRNGGDAKIEALSKLVVRKEYGWESESSSRTEEEDDEEYIDLDNM